MFALFLFVIEYICFAALFIFNFKKKAAIKAIKAGRESEIAREREGDGKAAGRDLRSPRQ